MPPRRARRILVIDIGGSKVKLLATGQAAPTKLPSGPTMTPRELVRRVKEVTAGWEYDVISIGFPAPVRDDEIIGEPHNLGPGWVGFDFERAFGHPVHLINDAAMQALGSYDGGRMLFLGLGTGLGSALVVDGTLVPLELAHLPYHNGRTYEEMLGARALQRLGERAWMKEVARVVELLKIAFVADYVVLGGGNVKRLETMPPGARRGANRNAFAGGMRLWDEKLRGAAKGSAAKKRRVRRPA